jgi:hypothetical protein
MSRTADSHTVANLDFFEDLLALTSKEYLRSIREARADHKRRRTFYHRDVFRDVVVLRVGHRREIYR